jgi:hypothetical protein
VHQYAAHVAAAFGETAQGDDGHVGPRLVADPVDDVDQHGEAEEAGEEGVGGEVGRVAVYGAFDWAEVGYGFAASGDGGTGGAPPIVEMRMKGLSTWKGCPRLEDGVCNSEVEEFEVVMMVFDHRRRRYMYV